MNVTATLWEAPSFRKISGWKYGGCVEQFKEAPLSGSFFLSFFVSMVLRVAAIPCRSILSMHPWVVITWLAFAKWWKHAARWPFHAPGRWRGP